MCRCVLVCVLCACVRVLCACVLCGCVCSTFTKIDYWNLCSLIWSANYQLVSNVSFRALFWVVFFTRSCARSTAHCILRTVCCLLYLAHYRALYHAHSTAHTRHSSRLNASLTTQSSAVRLLRDGNAAKAVIEGRSTPSRQYLKPDRNRR